MQRKKVRMSTKGRPLKSDWEKYEKLNCAIAQEIFGEDGAGQPVYLYLEHDVLARIAKDAGFSPSTKPDERLIEVVKATLSDPDSSSGVFSAHTAQARLWELGGNSTPPPCIAILAVLSLVAERMKQTEEFAGSNYYGRLMQMLDIDGESRGRVERDFRKETPICGTRSTDGLKNAMATAAYLPLSHLTIVDTSACRFRKRLSVRKTAPNCRCCSRSADCSQVSGFQSRPCSSCLRSGSHTHRSRNRSSAYGRSMPAERESQRSRAPSWKAGTAHYPVTCDQRRHKHDDNLLLAAELRTHPRPAIELLLVARHSGLEGSRLAVLSPDVSGTARLALESLGAEMRLQRIPGTSWESIEPSHLVSCPELLIANVSLAAPASGGTYTRRAKRLILLKRHEADHLFIEARRAELLETYLILVIQELAHSVREVLQSTARAGFRELTHETLNGLPSGWTAFDSVQLERIPSIAIDDLRPLQPIGRTHLALGGGLPLPGMNVWHGDRLPELRVVVDEHNETNVAHVRAVPDSISRRQGNGRRAARRS